MIMMECLVCGDKQEQGDDDDPLLDLLVDNEEAKGRFHNLCEALGIPGVSWNFKKERVRLCLHCSEMADRLGVITQQIRSLEEEYRLKVKELRKAIEDNTSLTSETETCSDHTPNFKRFRQLVTQSTGGRKRGRPRKQRGTEEEGGPTQPPALSKVKRGSTVQVKVEDKDTKEHEGRNNRNRVTKFEPEYVDNEEDDVPEEVEPPCVDNMNDVSENKTEDNEEEEVHGGVLDLEDLDQEEEKIKPKRSRRLLTSKYKNRISRTRRTRKTYPEGDENSEQENDTNYSDTEEGSSQRECRKGRSTRKWKIYKKKGTMSYDGVEVTIVPNGLQCSECGELIPGDKKGKGTRSKARDHIVSKHLSNFVCPICDKKLARQKNLEWHIKTVHDKSVSVPCQICGKPFTSVNAMRRHSWSHQSEEEKKAALAAGKKYYSNGSEKLEMMQCGQCGKLCRGAFNLKQHEEVHVDIKERQKHMCQICGSIYSNHATLKHHIKTKHENNDKIQWLQCPHCPRKYHQPGLLEKHIRVHTGDRPHVCEECGARFIHGTLLKVHLLKHKNLRPHQCEFCEMAFYRPYHLRRHTQIYHLNPHPPVKKQPYRSANGTRKAPQKRDRRNSVVPQKTQIEYIVTTTTTEVIPSISHNPHDPLAHQEEEETHHHHLDNNSNTETIEIHHQDATSAEDLGSIAAARQLIELGFIGVSTEPPQNFSITVTPGPEGGEHSHAISFTFPQE